MSSTVLKRLCIPVADSNEVVVVPINQLPESPEDLLEILTCEASPLGIWFDFARAYLFQGKTDNFVYILQEGTSKEVQQEVEKYFGYKPTYEQIQFYCGLGSFYTAKYKEERDPVTRGEYLSKAQSCFMQAKQLDVDEQMPYLGLGLLALAKNDQMSAKHEFTTASQKTNQGRPNVLGCMALAGLLFNQGNYKEALALYRKALRDHPKGPAEIRLGIASCCFKLGDLTTAAAAYERALALDPECAEALLGLAVIKFNSSNMQQGVADGMKLLVRAYQLDPSNVLVLQLLAHFSLLRADYEKVLVLAKAALDATDNDDIKANCLTILARAYHAKGMLAEATSHYNQASRLNSRLPLPHLGMAQMQIKQKEYMNAASELEDALKHAPGFYDALKILGQLYPVVPTKVEKTTNDFREAAAKQSEDPQIWEMLGELLSTTDPAASLSAYKHALDIHRKRQKEVTKKKEDLSAQWKVKQARKAARAERAVDVLLEDEEEDEDDTVDPASEIPDYLVPPKLLNNAAVLFYRGGHTATALSLMEEALQGGMREDSGVAAMHKVTLGFNMARLQDASGDTKTAKEGYLALLDQFPGYIDCYLRLSCIARNVGDADQAVTWAKKALEVEGGSGDARALLAQLHMDRKEWELARTVLYELVSDPSTKHDTYGQVQLANYYLYTVPHDRRKPEAKARGEERLKKAQEFFMRVLQRDKSNVCAAHGLGAVLAEMGQLDAAREIFTQVQEAVAASGGFLTVPDMWVNQGHIHLAKQEYVSAIRLYQSTLSKMNHSSRTCNVLLSLSRAYYDSKDFGNAKRYLMKAIHMAPTDYQLRFNAAITMQNWAVDVYRKPRTTTDSTKVDEYRQAMLELEQAVRMFVYLKEIGVEASGVDEVKLNKHIKFCTDQMHKVQDYVTAAERELLELQVKRDEQAKLLALAQAQRELAEAQRAAKAAEEVRRKQEGARMAQERAETVRSKWRQEHFIAEPDAEGGEGGGGDKKSRKRKKKAAAVAQDPNAGFIVEPGYDSGDDEDYKEAGGEEEMLAQAGLLSDDEDGGEANGEEDEEAPSQGKNKKQKKKRLRAGAARAEEEEGGDEGLLEDGLEDEGAANGEEDLFGVDDDEEEGGAKKRTKRVALADSDEERGGGADEDDLFGDDD